MAENKDGAEKTEEATVKRLQDAREKGQVSKSQDVTTAGVLLIGGLIVFGLGSTMFAKLRGFFSSAFSTAAQFDFTDTNISLYLLSLISILADLLLPIFISIFILVLITEISQVGLKIATKKWSDPETWKKPFKLLSGLKRVFFSSRSFVELLKGIAKILVLGGMAVGVIWHC